MCAMLVTTAAAAQSNAEIIRGRILSPDSTPLAGAEVLITGVSSRTERKVKTNKDGVYTALFSQGDGEYVVAARALGYKVQRIRLTRPKTGNVFIGDVSLNAVGNSLETINVQGARTSVSRTKDDTSFGGDRRDLRRGALFSLDPSDLNRLLENQPGIMMLPGGQYSALGSPPDQNSIVADGAKLAGGRLPQEGIESVTQNMTDYDASHGNYAGAQTRVVTRSGTNFFDFRLNGNYSDPRLSWGQHDSPYPVAREQDWDGGFSGPIKKNSSFFALSGNLHRSTTPVVSLLNLSRVVMEQQGYIADTLQAVKNVLGDLNVPITTSAIPSSATTTSSSFLGRADMNPTATSSLTLRANGSWTRTDGGSGPSTFPASGAFSQGMGGNLYAALSSYWGKFLNEFNVGLAYEDSKNSPYVSLPAGTVLITSLFNNGLTGQSSVQFGGSTQGRSDNKKIGLQLQNDLSLLTVDSKHQLKIHAEYSHDATQTFAGGDEFGTFAYQTLADLQANRPASYSRTLSTQNQRATSSTEAISIGDHWQRNPTLGFDYGLRLDFGQSGVKIPYNPLVDSLFGRRTDFVPRTLGFTPRFDFNWTQGMKDDPALRAAFGGDMARMVAVQRAQAMFGKSPLTISGGIGGFRGIIQPGEIAGRVNQTGLPNSVRNLMCVGDATPIPLWDQYGNGTMSPEQCLDGTTAQVQFSGDQPPVSLFDRSYGPPVDWKANISVGGLGAHGWELGINTEYNYGTSHTSAVDLNLRRTPVFTLPGEGRPMYVSPDAIVASSGLISPVASRVDSRFGTVMNSISDNRSFGTMTSITLQRHEPLFGKLPLSLTYTYNTGREQKRGIGLDPFVQQWIPGATPTHQFSTMQMFSIKWFYIMGQLALTSGSAYTPTANMDLNGDGQPQDPAFMFDPAMVTDSVLRHDLQSLLANSPSARKCLQPQIGRIVGVNSCRTGWHLVPNINLTFQAYDPRFNPAKSFGWQDRLNFTFVTQNGFNLLLRALHLSNTSLASNFAQSQLDPNLYQVVGFDPTTRQYRYRVNQQFGETSRRQVRGAVPLQPFQVTLRGTFHLGGPPQQPMAEALGLVPPEGQPAYTREEIHEHLRQLVASPVKQLIEMQDVLVLTQPQIAQLQTLDSNFVTRSDSMSASLVDYIAEKGRKVENSEFLRKFSKLQTSFQKAMPAALREAGPILTDEQVKRLPPYFQDLLKPSRKEARLNGISPDSSKTVHAPTVPKMPQDSTGDGKTEAPTASQGGNVPDAPQRTK